jgi:hypothetical protein
MLQPPLELVEELEARVQETLQRGDYEALPVLGGHGDELATVLKLDSGESSEQYSWAMKRFPVLPSLHAAKQHQRLIARYCLELKARGVLTVPYDFTILPCPSGKECVMYMVQRCVDPSRIGPAYFKSLTDEEALEQFDRMLGIFEEAVTSNCTPNGQLSNWVFEDDGIPRLFYLSTPFLLEDDGSDPLNWEALVESHTSGLLTPLYFSISSYFSLREQVIDFLGNLRMEGLDRHLDAFIHHANERLRLSSPITLATVRAHYNDDATTWATFWSLQRINRWFYQHVLRKTYPILIPPPIDRHMY